MGVLLLPPLGVLYSLTIDAAKASHITMPMASLSKNAPMATTAHHDADGYPGGFPLHGNT
jgi:hypothetical protein